MHIPNLNGCITFFILLSETNIIVWTDLFRYSYITYITVYSWTPVTSLTDSFQSAVFLLCISFQCNNMERTTDTALSWSTLLI